MSPENMLPYTYRCRKKWTKIPINDVWIAASCMEVGGTLLTRDKHFDVVDQIEMIFLAVGSNE